MILNIKSLNLNFKNPIVDLIVYIQHCKKSYTFIESVYTLIFYILLINAL